MAKYLAARGDYRTSDESKGAQLAHVVTPTCQKNSTCTSSRHFAPSQLLILYLYLGKMAINFTARLDQLRV